MSSDPRFLSSTFKECIVSAFYKLSTFSLTGDGWFLNYENDKKIKISCIINFYGRLDLLGGILHSLTEQNYPKEHFEVILVEDQGGSEKGKRFCESFANRLNIVYMPLDKNFGKMGYSRNFALARALGRYILFLDDDTVILQNNFLQSLEDTFLLNPKADAIIPRGRASYCLWPEKYDYHDLYFPTSRCTAYRLRVLKELGGFISSFTGQEDVEFTIRFTIKKKKALKSPSIEYFHPPLLIPDLKKPMAVGISFAGLRHRYPPFFLWIVVINCSRHIPLILSPLRHHREMGRFGLGFFLGFLKAWIKPETKGEYI